MLFYRLLEEFQSKLSKCNLNNNNFIDYKPALAKTYAHCKARFKHYWVERYHKQSGFIACEDSSKERFFVSISPRTANYNLELFIHMLTFIFNTYPQKVIFLIHILTAHTTTSFSNALPSLPLRPIEGWTSKKREFDSYLKKWNYNFNLPFFTIYLLK